ncbi:hypothetical protein CERZMDRAFT_41881 [Cercospora zeae-maydis SCOH1-5]|uniref:EKC/KEOPS complex subunit BUD32 n=1 Tax=Cercospora zeae-maydis SCOH1-5 TaxID=717836 RepID=A0A6A6FFD0_9PEZI|nr:hypothetical protein CERZMDRAFT_41881 [Cercospora zeae-maydis SCOH1-5]
MPSDDIQYPPGFGLADVVAWGSSGLVVIDEKSGTIIKAPFDTDNEWCSHSIRVEQRIYERLAEKGSHQGILSYYGVFDLGIRIEYAANHDLQSYLKTHNVAPAQVIVWARQVAEAINFIHRAGIIHGDITCANILLDRELNARLADFAGSSIDGSPLLVSVTSSHKYPRDALDAQVDLFAFGSALYSMITRRPPYEELSSEEIEYRFSNGKFPETASLNGVGSVVERCWRGYYPHSKMVVADLRGIHSD